MEEVPVSLLDRLTTVVLRDLAKIDLVPLVAAVTPKTPQRTKKKAEVYMEFHEVTQTGKKTKVWTVKTATGGLLGHVKWWPAWRRYTFQPESHTVFDEACLRALQEFLDRAMVERKEEQHQEEQVVRPVQGCHL